MGTAAGAAYRPRDAAGSALYRAVLDHLETYLAARSRAKTDPSHPVAEEFAGRNRVKQLVLMHQDDAYGDAVLDDMALQADALIAQRKFPLKCLVAREGLRLIV